ncbi:MIT domain-containing protein 1 [Anopheles nili]|uniref:MIT domain-containing protein 1 n=1 Tax=Anopheles nili TaxID=185578 RepID=UPI00237C4B21|nr:MIT domain-containing protein 1 [Anopheles nili]
MASSPLMAITLLTRAIEYDVIGRKLEALKLYQDGIESLLKESKAETDAQKKRHYQNKIVEYMNRAEQVKELLDRIKNKGVIKDKFHIVDDSTGYDYHRIFNKYLNDSVREILIEEPYVRDHYQICNLVRFCELAVSSCTNLKYVQLMTIKDAKNNDEQGRAFHTLAENLQQHAVKFVIEYSEHMHDRQVILSNGYIVKIGRGLNYFKRSPSNYCLGAFSYNFRKCLETNVDVFYCPENDKS